METRDVLLKADKVVLVIERISDGKIRVTTMSWDDAKVILPNQVLEVATIGKQVGLVRVDRETPPGGPAQANTFNDLLRRW